MRYKKLERTIFEACKKGVDTFVIPTCQIKNNEIIDYSEEYARLFTSDPDSFSSFRFYEIGSDEVMEVKFNPKSAYIKSLYADTLEKEIQQKKRKELMSAELEKVREEYAEMTLSDIPEVELIDLVQNYTESTMIFKYRKIKQLSFKKMRMAARDYLYEICRP